MRMPSVRFMERLALSAYGVERLFRSIFCGLIGTLLVAGAQAQTTVVRIDPAAAQTDLSKATWLLEDPDGNLTVADVQRPDNASRFRLGSPSIGLSSSAWWLRLEVQNMGEQVLTRWLDSGNRKLQEIDLFAPDASGIYQQQSGSSKLPFVQRPLPLPTFVFPIDLPPSLSATLFLRVRSTGTSPVVVVPKVWNPADLQRQAQGDKVQWLLYVGMAIALAGFNLLLYFSIRQIDYLLYVLSVISTVLFVSSNAGGFGPAYEYLWPESPVFEQMIWSGSAVPVAIFVLAFLNSLLSLRHRQPWFYWGALANCMAYGSLLGSGAIMVAMQVPDQAWLMQPFATSGSFFGAIAVVLQLIAIVRSAIDRDRTARLVVVAWSPLAVASLLHATRAAVGMAGAASLVMWGSAAEMLLMSLVLADRFKQSQLAKNQALTEKAEAQAALVASLKQYEHELEGKVAQRTTELRAEKVRTQDLLHNMLPVEIADELSATGSARPARHESVTVLFTDFSGFTQAASTMPADRMVAELNEVFAAFDDICDDCGVEKIKTIGDAYMAAAGLPKPCADHAQRCVSAGLRMVAYLQQRNAHSAFKWSLRVGIHSGPVVAGVVGKRKYAFDIWGDTVNIASRMESAGEPGRVNVSAYTYDLIRSEFDCDYRGKVDAKGKGQIDMYFVAGTKSAPE